jgi:hypothetical protein
MSKVHNKYHNSAPASAVYIGRGSPWGNPYVIGKDGTRDDVCNKFEKHTLPNLDLSKLQDKDLVCFCAPKRCHGHSIVKAIAEQKAKREMS